jgi:hypothetical protein
MHPAPEEPINPNFVFDQPGTALSPEQPDRPVDQ